MDSINLDKIRSEIAACSFLEEGSTQELRQAANAKRVILYRQLDDCRSKLDKLVDTAASTGEDYSEIEGLQREVEALAATLALRPVQRKPWPLFKAVDFLWRAPATIFFVVFLAIVVSIPLILLTMAERQIFSLLMLRRRGENPRRRNYQAVGELPRPSGNGSECTATPVPSPTNSISMESKPPSGDGTIGQDQAGPACDAAAASGFCSGSEGVNGNGNGCVGLSPLIKRLNARWLLLLMGVSVRAKGLEEPRRLLSRPAMLLFAHVSTLDAMIILGTFPRAMCAVVKEELFALPFIGWVMASHGGIPINRRDRASAVQALAETASRARELELFVAMAPEGTRSRTGQLGPFKKGALHMQEQLQWPVIPVTIHGAYELFPIKTYFNECGQVVVRFHRPIEAADIKSRDGLTQRLRQEMLDAMEVKTPEAGSALGPSRRAASTAATALTYVLTASAARGLTSLCQRESVSVWALVAGFGSYAALSTLFVYFVYARKCFGSTGKRRRKAGSTAGTGRAGGKVVVARGKTKVVDEGTPEAVPLFGAGEGKGGNASGDHGGPK